MTLEEARAVHNLVTLVNFAQQKGAYTLADAKVAIQSIDFLVPELERLLGPKPAQAPQVVEAQAS